MNRRMFYLIVLILAINVVGRAVASPEQLARAELLYLAKDYPGVISLLNSVLQDEPDNVEALYLTGISQYELGMIEEAKANLTLAHQKIMSGTAKTSEKRSVWRSLEGTPLQPNGEPEVSKRTDINGTLNPALVKFPANCRVMVSNNGTPVNPDPLYSVGNRPVYALYPGEIYRIRVEPRITIESKRFLWIAAAAAAVGFLATR